MGREIKLDSKEFEKIKSWPIPQNEAEVATSLGLCKYYRAFIQKCAKTADALDKTVQADPFKFYQDLTPEIEILKFGVSSESIVRIHRSETGLILSTDASLIAIGATNNLFFKEDNHQLPVNFSSRALSAPERRYSIYEKVLVAIVRACD